MLIQKLGFIQRIRIVLTALVILAGFGSTLLAMKPAEKKAAYTYGVAETSGGNHYQVIRNVTGVPPEGYNCDGSGQTCTIAFDQSPSAEGLILKTDAIALREGIFSDGD
jgi:hypothetical protein